MLDIRLLRENPDLVKERINARGGDVSSTVDEILECDEKRRAAETEKQTLQAKREGKDTSEIEAQVREIGEKIKAVGENADAADARQRELLLSLPNLPHEGCPVGDSEDENPTIREWGKQPTFEGFEPKDHVALGEELELFSFDLATKISSSGFITFTGQGAKLQRGLIQFLLNLHTGEHGYKEVAPPVIVNRDCMFGTGQLPKFEDDMYGIEDNQYFLAPTAEVPVTNLYREQIVDPKDFPIKTTAYTPCFRREAGSAGRESRGMIRMHQFDKVELVNIVHPDDSMAQLEKLTAEAEKVLQLLGLHYRTIELCTGDLGNSSVKTYDIEVWAPGHGGYLEVSSCSNFNDWQARRMGLRFKDPETGKNTPAHTLNGSGTALPRLYVAFVETYQQADGSIVIPEVLQPYMGTDRITA
ncbi:UNVERIFIED_CONTAM: hypothetical protein GTU68_004576 [Idotea baltica]|nr:hypothetical protein [Idotea baltica]